VQIDTFGLNRIDLPGGVGSEEKDAVLEREDSRLVDAMKDRTLDEDDRGAESLFTCSHPVRLKPAA
jgi:hypothetical protein